MVCVFLCLCCVAEDHVPADVSLAWVGRIWAAQQDTVCWYCVGPTHCCFFSYCCLSQDLAPSGLVSAANRAGLGAVNSSGAHLPPQVNERERERGGGLQIGACFDGLKHDLSKCFFLFLTEQSNATHKKASRACHIRPVTACCRVLGTTPHTPHNPFNTSFNHHPPNHPTTTHHTPTTPQMAQLNQATADARILGEVLQLAAANTAKLRQQLEEARQHAAWAEAAAEKRVSVTCDV